MLLKISELLCLLTIIAGQTAAKRQKDKVRNDGKKNKNGVSLGIIKPDTAKNWLCDVKLERSIPVFAASKTAVSPASVPAKDAIIFNKITSVKISMIVSNGVTPIAFIIPYSLILNFKITVKKKN